MAADAEGSPAHRVGRHTQHAHHASWGGGGSGGGFGSGGLGGPLAAGALGSLAVPPLSPLSSQRTDSLGYNASGGGLESGSMLSPGAAAPLPPPISVQRFFQGARVAELLQLKLLILLAYRERLEEAVGQASAHLQLFGKPPLRLPAVAAAAHAAYLARQMLVTAEVLATKLEASGGPLAAAAKECSRAVLLSNAAQLAVDRRRMLDGLSAAAKSGGSSGATGGYIAAVMPDLDTALVKRGPYVGTVALRLENGSTRELSDAEFLMWLEAEQLRTLPSSHHHTPSSSGAAAGAVAHHHPQQAPSGLWTAAPSPVEAINSALMVLRDQHMERQRARLGLLLAEEYVALGSLSAARKLLLQVAATYRKDGWDVPCAYVLLLLREVAGRLRLPSEHVAYSLELAALLAGLPSGDGQQQGLLAGLPAGELLAACAARGLPPPPPPEALSAACVGSLLAGHHDVGHLPGATKHARPSITDGLYSPVVTGGTATTGSGGGGPYRAFHYTVEHLDLAAASAARRSLSGSKTPSTSGAAGLAAAAAAAATDRPPTVSDLLQRHHQQDYGWSRVLGCAVAFPAAPTAEATSSLPLWVSLCCLLPSSLPITGLTATLADELASQWSVPLLEWPLPPDLPPFTPLSHSPTTPHRPSHSGAQDATTTVKGGTQQLSDAQPEPESRAAHSTAMSPHAVHAIDAGTTAHTAGGTSHLPTQWPSGPTHPLDADLQPRVWTPFATRLVPRGVGRLRVERLTVYIGQYTSVTFVVPSFPPGDAYRSLGGVVEKVVGLDAWGGGTPFSHLSRLGPLGGPAVLVQHVGRLPSLQLAAQPGVRAFVGEPFFVAAHVQVQGGGLPTSVLEFAVRALDAGTTPVQQAARHLSVIVDDRGSLEKYHGQDLARLQLPALGPQGSHTARLWVVAKQAGKVALAVTLQCPALVTQVLEFEVEEPLQLHMQATSDPGTHVLVTPPPPTGALPPPPTAMAAASPAAGAAGAAAAELLGPVLPLTVGQQALAHCAVCHAVAEHADSIELLSAEIVDTDTSGVSILTDLNSQLVTWQPPTDASSSPDQEPPPIELRHGDVAVLVTSLLPSVLLPVPTPLGRLQVTWRRRPAPKPTGTDNISLLKVGVDGSALWRVQPSNGAGGLIGSGVMRSTSSTTPAGKGGKAGKTDATDHAHSATPSRERAGVKAGDQLQQQQQAERGSGGGGGGIAGLDLATLAAQQPRPDSKVTSSLALPCVRVQEGILAVRVLAPPQATAGIAFSYTLQVQNYEAGAQELVVTLLDAPGFVLSGERGQQVTVPSRQAGGAQAVSWLLVAHTAGQLVLPSCRVVAPRHAASLVTQPAHVHVLPF